MSGFPGPVRQQVRGSLRIEHMTLEQILARARALMTEEVEDDELVAAVARQHQVLLHVPVGPPSTPDKQNAVAVPETVISLAANHKEHSQRYTVINANNKDMSHRGVRKTKQWARGQHYSLPT